MTLIKTAILVLMMVLVPFKSQPIVNQYPLTAEVVSLEYENDLVVVEDFNGNLWEFEGCEDWMEGDVVAMIMSDEGTKTIYDDEILQVRYCGYNY